MREIDDIVNDLIRKFEGTPYPGDTAHATVSWGVEVVAQVHRDDRSVNEHINDVDCWGKVSEYAYDYWRDGHAPRPVGFTGAARKIQVDRGYWVWWEPWDGFLKLSDEDQRKGQQQVRDLFEMGFLGVTVALRESLTDSMGNAHWVEVKQEGLWGIDSLENDYLRSVLTDLLDELLYVEDPRHPMDDMDNARWSSGTTGISQSY